MTDTNKCNLDGCNIESDHHHYTYSFTDWLKYRATCDSSEEM